MPNIVDDFEEFKAEFGHGFNTKELDLLQEYSRMKSTLEKDAFDEWYQQKLVEVAERGVDPRLEIIRKKLKPVKFD